MALQDFSIDTSGSPQEVQRKQALADALMKQGGDSTPAAGGKNGGWITALNRGLAGALGGYQRGAASEMEQQGRSQAQQLAAGLLGQDGKVDQQAYVQAASNPWVRPEQLGAVGKVQDWQHTAGRDAAADKHTAFSESMASSANSRAAAAEGRAAAEYENTPDQYAPNPDFGKVPGAPQYIDQYSQARAAAGDPRDLPAAVTEYEYYKKNFKPSDKQADPLDYQSFLGVKKSGMGAESAYTPELLGALADRLEAGDTSWKTGMARIPGLIKSVEEEAAKRGAARRSDNPDVKPAQDILQSRANQAGRVKEQATLGSASASNTLYGNAAASTMNTAIEKSAAVPRGKFVPLNQLLQAGEKNISDPALAELRTATNTLVNDYAKAITPVGVPTEGAREHARELLQMAYSHEAYVAVVKTMHREIENTHQAIEFTKKQLQSGKGGGIPSLSDSTSKNPASATPHPDETVATNPATGERLIKRNGQWVPFS